MATRKLPPLNLHAVLLRAHGLLAIASDRKPRQKRDDYIKDARPYDDFGPLLLSEACGC